MLFVLLSKNILRRPSVLDTNFDNESKFARSWTDENEMTGFQVSKTGTV